MNVLIILSLTAVFVLFAGLYKWNKLLLPASLGGLALAFAANLFDWNKDQYFFNQMIFSNNYAVAFIGLVIISTFLIFLLSGGYFEKISSNVAEYYALMLFALAGIVVIISYNNLAMLFIGIETFSISLYVLAGIRKKDPSSNEAALKYFLMGAFATGFLLFGIALVYGATGSFDIEVIGSKAGFLDPANNKILLTGILMMMVGLSFKVSAAPFHFWTPDVYEGSPSLITAFMSTVIKTGGFAAFLRLFLVSFSALPQWIPVLSVICALTLLVGNITAIYQHSFKRMMAYSSISHAGYLLLVIIALGSASSGVLLIYTAAYSLASILAFAALIRVKTIKGFDDFHSFNGLAKTNPVLAFTLTIAMCSLAGIPLTAGFFGKFLIFTNALSKGFTVLVIIAIINAVIGIYYYFKVIIAMYMKEQSSDEVIEWNNSYKWVMIFAALVTLILGFFPNLVTGIL